MSTQGLDIVAVAIENDIWSKINWTQVVAWVASGVVVWSGGKIDLDPQTQVFIVLTIQGIGGLVTIWFRRHSETITPTAAEAIREKRVG